jgi:hypothetical protein
LIGETVVRSSVLGVILTNTSLRAIEISRTGCLLECSRRIAIGTTGELRLKIERRTYSDVVKVTRCQRLEGAATSYRLGVEFLLTRRPSTSSLRWAVNSLLEAKGLSPAPGRTTPVWPGMDGSRNGKLKGSST